MHFFMTTLFESSAKKGRVRSEWEVGIEWEVFNKSQSNSIGTFYAGLYLLYLLKLPAPPCAVLLVIIFLIKWKKLRLLSKANCHLKKSEL